MPRRRSPSRRRSRGSKRKDVRIKRKNKSRTKSLRYREVHSSPLEQVIARTQGFLIDAQKYTDRVDFFQRIEKEFPGLDAWYSTTSDETKRLFDKYILLLIFFYLRMKDEHDRNLYENDKQEFIFNKATADGELDPLVKLVENLTTSVETISKLDFGSRQTSLVRASATPHR